MPPTDPPQLTALPVGLSGSTPPSPAAIAPPPDDNARQLASWSANQLRYVEQRALGKTASEALTNIGATPKDYDAWRKASPLFRSCEQSAYALAQQLPALAKLALRRNVVVAARRQLELMASPREDVAARMVDSALDRNPETARVSSRGDGAPAAAINVSLSVLLHDSRPASIVVDEDVII